jgi:hypothetical protein
MSIIGPITSQYISQLFGASSVTDKNGVVVKEEITPLSLVLNEGEPTTKIKCGLGMTINIGNFQNVKVDVSLEAPSNMDTDSLDSTFAFVKNWCETKLMAMKTEVEHDVAK